MDAKRFFGLQTDGRSTQQRVEVWGSLRQCGFGTLERSILAAAGGEGTGRGLQGAGARGGWRLGWEGSQVELVRGTSWCKKGGFLTKFSGIYIDAFRLSILIATSKEGMTQLTEQTLDGHEPQRVGEHF